MNKSVKALIFDLGEVIVFYDFMIAARQMSKIIDVPAKKIYDIISSNNSTKFTNLYEKGASLKVYWGVVARQLRVKKINNRKFDKILNTIFWLNKEILPIIKKLKKTYKIGLISNTGKNVKKYLSKKYNLRKYFSVRVYSCDVKIRKPNPKIFNIALKKLNVRPKEAVFIDDILENVKGAKKLGMKTILFKSNSQLKKELNRLLK